MFLWCFFIKRIKNQEVSSPLKTLLEMPMYFNNPRDGSYVWDDAYKNLSLFRFMHGITAADGTQIPFKVPFLCELRNFGHIHLYGE